jgi:hypothetical protein
MFLVPHPPFFIFLIRNKCGITFVKVNSLDRFALEGAVERGHDGRLSISHRPEGVLSKDRF